MKNQTKKFASIALAAAICTMSISFAATKSANIIPFPASYDIKTSGASAYFNSGDKKDSPYFKQVDFYNMKSGKTLTMISNYKTYQQTNESSCGPAAALTVLHHYKTTKYQELDVAKIMQTSVDLNKNNKENPGAANEQGEWGTSTDRMVKFFKQINWQVQSSLDNKDGADTFSDTAEFTKWIVKNLKENTPIMVEWLDWNGHWQAIIGYDTMGTESFGDDVLIVADPYDTSDHLQDGYMIIPAERFFYMWKDNGILPETQSSQQWVIAKPKTK